MILALRQNKNIFYSILFFGILFVLNLFSIKYYGIFSMQPQMIAISAWVLFCVPSQPTAEVGVWGIFSTQSKAQKALEAINSPNYCSIQKWSVM